MYPPKYSKCLVKEKTTPFNLTIAVSLHLVYSLFQHVRLCLSLSFTWSARVQLLGSVSSKVRMLKNPGDGKKMHSVFEGFFPVSMCILRPNQEKWSERRAINFFDVSTGLKYKCAIIYINHE